MLLVVLNSQFSTQYIPNRGGGGNTGNHVNVFIPNINLLPSYMFFRTVNEPKPFSAWAPHRSLLGAYGFISPLNQRGGEPFPVWGRGALPILEVCGNAFQTPIPIEPFPFPYHAYSHSHGIPINYSHFPVSYTHLTLPTKRIV